MTKEIFKDIPGYEGMYQVSDLGSVKSLSDRYGNERILKARIGTGGYKLVRLTRNNKKTGIRVHQLVAMAFLDHVRCGHKKDVHHIDGVRTNNKLSNLEVLTRQEHIIETWKSIGKTSAYTGVSWHKRSNRWKVQIRINGKQKGLGYFINEIDAHHAYQEALKNLLK